MEMDVKSGWRQDKGGRAGREGQLDVKLFWLFHFLHTSSFFHDCFNQLFCLRGIGCTVCQGKGTPAADMLQAVPLDIDRGEPWVPHFFDNLAEGFFAVNPGEEFPEVLRYRSVAFWLSGDLVQAFLFLLVFDVCQIFLFIFGGEAVETFFPYVDRVVLEQVFFLEEVVFV